MIIEILTIAAPVLTGVLGYFASHLTKSGRDKERALSDKAIKDNYEERISDLHKSVEALNETEVRQAKRIAELNAALDNKTVRIREVEDRLVHTERENTRLAEENGALKTDMAVNRCVIRKCGGRDPQNEHTIAALETGTAVFPSAPSVDVNVEVDVEKPVKKKSKRKAVVKE